MSEVEKFRSYMQTFDLDDQKIAKITGYPVEKVTDILQPGKELPRWLRLVLYVWEKTETRNQKKMV
ncbi:MAG: hypothetical protein AAF901_14185 [Bacteroidota bacterium]